MLNPSVLKDSHGIVACPRTPTRPIVTSLRFIGRKAAAQLMNHLRATGLKVGLLINFSHYPGVEHERFVI